MSATRLLVLGVVRMYGRAHGYLVSRELLSWGTAEWANVKAGSIYHALRQLAKEGLLTETQIAEWPGRVDYEPTAAGEAEFFRLLREALRRPDPHPDMLGAGLIFLTELTRSEAIGLLRERLGALERARSASGDLVASASWEAAAVPDHVRELGRLWEHAAESGVAWTGGLIGRLGRGAYVMAGEEGTGCEPEDAGPG